MAQTENLPYADQTIDLDPNVRDAWGLPAPRLTYDWRRPNERARVEFMQRKMEEIGRRHGRIACVAGAGRRGRAGRPSRGRHPHGQRSEELGGQQIRSELGYPEPVRHRQLDLPDQSGFNPTLTIQALAYMSADAIVNRYQKSPGPLI